MKVSGGARAPHRRDTGGPTRGRNPRQGATFIGPSDGTPARPCTYLPSSRTHTELLSWLEDMPRYAFAAHPSLLSVPTALRRRQGLTTLVLELPTTHACFGPPPRQALYEHVLGYDAVLGNSAFVTSGGRGT